MTKKDYQKFADLFVEAYKLLKKQQFASEFQVVDWFETRIIDIFHKDNNNFDTLKWSKWIDKRLKETNVK